jgi:hypothetical protein
MTFAQRRNHLTTHFSERIPVVKRRITVVRRWTHMWTTAVHDNSQLNFIVIPLRVLYLSYLFTYRLQHVSAIKWSYSGIRVGPWWSQCLPERVADGKYITEVQWAQVSCVVLCCIVLYVFARYKLNHFETALHILGILLCVFFMSAFF